MAAPVGDEGTFYLEKLSVEGDSDESYEYEEVPVDDVSSLASADLVEDWNKTMAIIEQSRREKNIELKNDNQPISSLVKKPEVIDDFVRNFLRRNDLKRTMNCFQTEWYEKKQKGLLDNVEIYNVPDALYSLMLLTDEVKRLKTERNKFESAAKVAKESYVKVMKERDFHRLHHQRVVQEKNRLITDIKRLKKHYMSYEPTLKSMKIKYEKSLREKMMMGLERDKAVTHMTSLQASIRNTSDSSATDIRKGKEIQQSLSIPLGPTQERLKRERESGYTQDQINGTTRDYKKQETFTNKSDSTWPIDTRVNPLLSLNRGVPTSLTRSGGLRQVGSTIISNRPISSVALHPKKQLMITSSDDCKWRIHVLPNHGGEANTQEVMCGVGHQDWLSDAQFDLTGSFVATSSGDTSIKLWDMESGQCVTTFQGHSQSVWNVSWHHTSSFIATSSMDQTVKIWDLSSERCRTTLRGHHDSVNRCSFVPFGNILITCSADKTVSMWDARTKLCAHTFYGHQHSINDVQFTQMGDTIVSCDSFGFVKMWDTRTISCMATYNCGPHSANCVTIEPSGHVMAIASDDTTAKLIDIGSSNIISLGGGGNTDSVNSCVFDNSASFLLCASGDGNVRMWS